MLDKVVHHSIESYAQLIYGFRFFFFFCSSFAQTTHGKNILLWHVMYMYIIHTHTTFGLYKLPLQESTEIETIAKKRAENIRTIFWTVWKTVMNLKMLSICHCCTLVQQLQCRYHSNLCTTISKARAERGSGVRGTREREREHV